MATVRGAIRLMTQLHAATDTQVEPSQVLLRPDMTPFLTRQKYELRLVLEELTWRSPVLRFALAPPIEILLTGEDAHLPGGVGELGVPAVAPA